MPRKERRHRTTWHRTYDEVLYQGLKASRMTWKTEAKLEMRKRLHPVGKRSWGRLLGGALAGLLLTTTLFSAPVQAEGNSSAGVKITVDYTGRSEGFAAILYDNTNGLPTAEANAILETKSGLIWIGSYSGLIRYDGIPLREWILRRVLPAW